MAERLTSQTAGLEVRGPTLNCVVSLLHFVSCHPGV